jgi:hypothetical protein
VTTGQECFYAYPVFLFSAGRRLFTGPFSLLFQLHPGLFLDLYPLDFPEVVQNFSLKGRVQHTHKSFLCDGSVSHKTHRKLCIVLHEEGV